MRASGSGRPAGSPVGRLPAAAVACSLSKRGELASADARALRKSMSGGPLLDLLRGLAGRCAVRRSTKWNLQ